MLISSNHSPSSRSLPMKHQGHIPSYGVPLIPCNQPCHRRRSSSLTGANSWMAGLGSFDSDVNSFNRRVCVEWLMASTARGFGPDQLRLQVEVCPYRTPPTCWLTPSDLSDTDVKPVGTAHCPGRLVLKSVGKVLHPSEGSVRAGIPRVQRYLSP